MKTTSEERAQMRGMAAANRGDGASEAMLILLDDVDELLHANERLAPKAKAHDRLLSELLRIAETTP